MIMELLVRDIARVGKVSTNLLLTPQLAVIHDDATNPENLVLGQFTTDANGPTLQGVKARGTVAAPADVVSADRVFDFQGYAYSGGTLFNNANMRLYIDGAFVSGQAPPMRFDWETGIANGVPAVVMTLTSAGLLGIGVSGATGPQASLHVGNAGAGVEQIEQHTSADAEGARVVLRKTRGTLAAPTAILQNDRLFQVYADMQASAGVGNTLRGASIECYARSAPVNGQRTESDLEFYTNVQNSVPVLAMYIKGDGKVGVGNFTPGTTDAGELLHSRTAGTNTLVWGLQVENPNNTNNNATGIGIIFGADSNTALAKGALAYVRDATDWGRGRFQLLQNTSAAANKPSQSDAVVVVENNGNVGVGHSWTSSFVPVASIHIAEDIAKNASLRIQQAQTYPFITFQTSNGTLAAPTNSAQNDVIMSLETAAYANGVFSGGYIRMAVDAAVVNNQAPATRIDFYVNKNNASASRAVFIDSNSILNFITSSVPTVALTDGANIAVDANLSDWFSVTLAGNRTLSNPTNAADGRKFSVRIRQDATGSRTLAYGANYRFPGGVTPVLTITAAKTDILTFRYHSGDSKWDLIGSQFNL